MWAIVNLVGVLDIEIYTILSGYKLDSACRFTEHFCYFPFSLKWQLGAFVRQPEAWSVKEWNWASDTRRRYKKAVVHSSRELQEKDYWRELVAWIIYLSDN